MMQRLVERLGTCRRSGLAGALRPSVVDLADGAPCGYQRVGHLGLSQRRGQDVLGGRLPSVGWDRARCAFHGFEVLNREIVQSGEGGLRDLCHVRCGHPPLRGRRQRIAQSTPR